MVDRYDAYTFRLPTPEGTATIIINETAPGKIFNIFMFVGKAGNSVNALCDALVRMVTTSLEIKSLSEILSDLSGITSSRIARIGDGILCRSVPEALYLALVRYHAANYPTLHNDDDDEYRPPRFTSLRAAI